MNARHTSVIIELALLDNKQNRERLFVGLTGRLSMPAIQFAKSFCSVRIDLGRAAGHSSHAQRLWKAGATLVVKTETEVRHLAQGLPSDHPLVASRNAWMHSRSAIAPKIAPGSLIVFDRGSDLFEAMSHADIYWPALYDRDHTYLFLG
jgi:hypothetical protein